MEVKDIKFKLSKEINLTEKDKEELEIAYENLFRQIYGDKYYSDLVKLATKPKHWYQNAKYFEHFANAINVIDSVLKNPNMHLLTISNENGENLGFGRVLEINDCVVSIPDIAFTSKAKEDESENIIWHQAITYLENYFAKLGFKRIYVEIPFNDIPKLKRAYFDLEYIEDDRDIEITESSYTYYLNKTLERIRTDEPSHHR